MPRGVCHLFMSCMIRPSDVSFTAVISFFFSRNMALGSRAEDGHQMYSERSVVGEASSVDPEISPTPHLIFTGGEVRNLAYF